MSPERILAERYSYSSDIWSMGLVLIECATNKYPYSGINSMIEMAQTVTEAEPPTLPPQSGFSSEFHNFVDMCLKKDPKERPLAQKLLGDPWVKLHDIRKLKTASAECKSWVDELLDVTVGGSNSAGSKRK
jgi:serine/threonine protein kinase